LKLLSISVTQTSPFPFPFQSKSKGPSDHNIDIWFIDQDFKSSLVLIKFIFSKMALRRIDKKKAVAGRTARPRAVATAARQAYLARTHRNIPDEAVADPPESPAIQAAPLVNLSVPTSELTPGLAVMSLHPASVLPASAEIPVSTETPVSSDLPASAAIPRTIAPSTQYVRVGESAIPTRQQVHEITQLLLSKDGPFTAVDVVHHNSYFAMETLLIKSSLPTLRVEMSVQIGCIRRIRDSAER
jgi:hypothetical protein